jgi:hypothetical protein
MKKIHNICANCNKNYYGQGKIYCSIECRNKGSKNKPQKKRSEETKTKLSLSHKGKKLTEETKQKIGSTSKKRWESEEYKKKQYNSRVGKVVSEETKKKISESQKGIPRPYLVDYNKNRPKVSGWKHSEESKKKISEGVSGNKNGMYGKLPKFNKPTEYIKDDLKIFMRSTWEVKFANWLDDNGKKWEYEKHTFKLSDGYTYTPDFLCEGIFYEVKGYLHKRSKEKIEIFQKDYPNKKFIIVDRDFFKKNNIKL